MMLSRRYISPKNAAYCPEGKQSSLWYRFTREEERSHFFEAQRKNIVAKLHSPYLCASAIPVKGDRNVDTKEGKVTASVEELAHYNMLLTEAIYELLADKGIVSKEEVVERVRKLKVETTVNFRRVQ